MPRWSAGERALIDECLHTWSADTESSAIATNLRSECALGLASFVELLRKFAGRLADSPERWRDASSWSGLWVDACKPY